MRQNISKKWLAAFSIPFVAIGIALACGGDWGYLEWGKSSFAPEAAVKESYTPFFYDPSSAFYQIGFDTRHTTRFNDDVVSDWRRFLDGKMKKENIAMLLLSDEAGEELDELNDYVAKKVKNASSNRWRSLTDLNDKSVQAFIQFAHIARQIDELAAPVEDEDSYWNYKNSARIAGDGIPQPLIDILAERYKSASDPFLKNRYWFQQLKALFYANKPVEFEAFFEKTKQQVEKNTLYYRALGYLAAFRYEKKEYKKANLLYADMFDKAPALRTVAAYSFHLQDEEEWRQTLQMAASDDEKAALWALLGYYKDEERAINEIYKLNPKNSHIDMLLTRLVNKAEADEKNELFGVTSSSDEKIDARMFKTITRIASENKTSNPYLWYLAAGYISTWEGKYSAAENYFDQAERLLPDGQPLAKEQLRLLRVVNKIDAIKTVKGNNVEKILNELTWLYNLHNNAPENLRYQHAAQRSKEYLATLYAKENNTLYSELFKHEDSFYAEPRNADKMIAFLLKTEKTPFEQMLYDIYPLPIDAIYHYKALTALFNDDIEGAIANMQKSSYAKTTLLGNPFSGFVKDCNDCDHARKQSVKYTSLTLLIKMKEMKQMVEQNSDVYNNSMLLGNAYYNLALYGNARLFSATQLTTGNSYGEIYPGSYTMYLIPCAEKLLANYSIVKRYYNKAADNAQDDEQRAKTAYMLAKCQRNEFYNRALFADNEDSLWEKKSGVNEEARSMAYAWDGFKELNGKYAHTKYYKEVINECGYFRNYVEKRR